MEDDGEVVERTFTETVVLYRIDGRFLFYRPDIDRRNRETGDREDLYPGYTVEEEDLYFVKRRNLTTGEEVKEWIDMKCLLKSFKDRRFQWWRITETDAAGSLFWTKLCWDEMESVARIGRVTCFKAKPDVSAFIGMVSRPLTDQEYWEILRSET